MFSILTGKFEIMSVLVKAGADLNCRNDRGKTAADLLSEMHVPLSLSSAVLKLEDGEDSDDSFSIWNVQSPKTHHVLTLLRASRASSSVGLGVQNLSSLLNCTSGTVAPSPTLFHKFLYTPTQAGVYITPREVSAGCVGRRRMTLIFLMEEQDCLPSTDRLDCVFRTRAPQADISWYNNLYPSGDVQNIIFLTCKRRVDEKDTWFCKMEKGEAPVEPTVASTERHEHPTWHRNG